MLLQSKDWSSYFQWLPLPNKTQIKEKKSHQGSVLYNRRNKHQFGKDIRAINTRKKRRVLYHLYEHVLSKTKTARINGLRLISVLDSV